ncbi:MAG: M50 family metallopeptidase [Chloroflexi bacterium]|nr:M50 family metallopeptidase [Chloroflexota bacterium]
MQKFFRLFWVLILLLSLGWVVGGALVTSGALDDAGVSEKLREDIAIFADGLNVPPEIQPSLLFVITGLPLALLSLFFAWRNHRTLAMQAEAQKQKLSDQRGTLFITALSLLFALLLWNARGVDDLLAQGAPSPNSISLTAVTYPVRLFVTFVHEAGHALAALLTGGQIQSFTVSPDGSGYAITAGGSASLILPAGYLGAALFGALLFLLSSRAPSLTRALSLLLGIGFIALTVLFARPDASGNMTALVVGLGYGLALVLLGWQAPQSINVFLLNTLAILTGLNAVFDLAQLVTNSDIGNAGVVNDAAAFSQKVAPLLPPSVVALLWAAIAVGMMGAAMYFGLLKPVRSELA